MPKNVLEHFYTSVVESACMFGILVWGGAITRKDKKTMNCVRQCACSTIWHLFAKMGDPVQGEVGNAGQEDHGRQKTSVVW